MSECITATPQSFENLQAQLDLLWKDADTFLVDAFARIAMYESFAWDPKAAGFDQQPLRLELSPQPRSTIYATSLHVTSRKEDDGFFYPCNTSYDNFFSPRSKTNPPALKIFTGSEFLYHELSEDVYNSRQRTLANRPVRTLSIGAHAELERLVLATGNYPEPPEERAKDVAAFGAFADYVRSTGQHPEEFPDLDSLLVFSAASRALYFARSRHLLHPSKA